MTGCRRDLALIATYQETQGCRYLVVFLPLVTLVFPELGAVPKLCPSLFVRFLCYALCSFSTGSFLFQLCHKVFSGLISLSPALLDDIT